MTDTFFDGITQHPIDFHGIEAKIPVFYRSARMFSLVFPARLSVIKKMLPDRRFKPALLAPGVGAVHLSAFEYHDCDIEPYNEFALGALLTSPDFAAIPGYNATRQLMTNLFHTYILRLPVTTEIARRAGVDLYNYPKFVSAIDFSDDAQNIACEVAEEGELICRLQTRKIAAPKSAVAKYFCHLYQDGQPQSTEFKVNAQSLGLAFGPGRAKLEVGKNHPMAKEIDALLLSKTPLFTIYMPEMQAVLYGPDRLTITMAARFLEHQQNNPARSDALRRVAP